MQFVQELHLIQNVPGFMGLDILGTFFFLMFCKGDNGFDFWFAFLLSKPFLKMDVL